MKLIHQLDAMDCGPACLKMITDHHGCSVSLQKLREKCHISREGVSLAGISEAAESLGLRTMADKVTYDSHRDQPGFKKYWDINKDKIYVCKDCEFRYICTDCRAYVEDPEDILSKPLKCGYNPYTGEWSEWSKNVLKTKAILNYKLDHIS